MLRRLRQYSTGCPDRGRCVFIHVIVLWYYWGHPLLLLLHPSSGWPCSCGSSPLFFLAGMKCSLTVTHKYSALNFKVSSSVVRFWWFLMLKVRKYVVRRGYLLLEIMGVTFFPAAITSLLISWFLPSYWCHRTYSYNSRNNRTIMICCHLLEEGETKLQVKYFHYCG